MNDFRGREIKKGDKVIYVRKGRYTSLMTGIVLGMTPKMVQLATSYSNKFDNINTTTLSTTVNPENVVIVED